MSGPDLPAADASGFASGLEAAGNSLSVQIALGTLPWAGGIGAALAAYADQRRAERLDALVHEVNSAYEAVVERVNDVDDELKRTKEFADRALTVATHAVGEPQPEKIAYLAKYLVAATRYSRPDETWLNLFWRYVDRLSGTHMLVLNAYYEQQRGVPASDRLGRRELKNVPVRVETVSNLYLDRQLVQIASADLANLGLLADWRSIAGGEMPVGEAFTATRNGFLFMKFMNFDWPSLPGAPPAE